MKKNIDDIELNSIECNIINPFNTEREDTVVKWVGFALGFACQRTQLPNKFKNCNTMVRILTGPSRTATYKQVKHKKKHNMIFIY